MSLQVNIKAMRLENHIHIIKRALDELNKKISQFTIVIDETDENIAYVYKNSVIAKLGDIMILDTTYSSYAHLTCFYFKSDQKYVLRNKYDGYTVWSTQLYEFKYNNQILLAFEKVDNIETLMQRGINYCNDFKIVKH